MTATHLLVYIAAAVLLQISMGIGFAVIRRVRADTTALPDRRGPVRASPGLAAWVGWRDFRVTRRVFEDAAETQCSFYLEPADHRPLPAFRPGQYLTFSLTIDPAVGAAAGTARTITRCYSLSDSPDPTAYRITVKRVPAPAGMPQVPPGLSSGHFHDRVQVGDTIQVKAPSGHFFIDPDPTVPTVLIAGGIGITPLFSMLRWAAAQPTPRTIHLYYGVRDENERIFRPFLDELVATRPSFHFHPACSGSSWAAATVPDSSEVRARRVDLALLRQTLPHGRHRFYVCGPPTMMSTLIPDLRQWGVAEEDLHFESFGPASASAPIVESSASSTANALTIRFEATGRSLAWDGRSANLLEFAERHGVPVESGCRAGSCGTCETGLVSGTVRYPREPDYDLSPGCCLLCVGLPDGDVVLAA